MATVFSVFAANVDNIERAAINAALRIFDNYDLAECDHGSNAYSAWGVQLNEEFDDAVYNVVKSALEADNSGLSAKGLEHVGVLLMRRINALKLWKSEVREAYRSLKFLSQLKATIASDEVLNSLYERGEWDVLSRTIGFKNELYARMLRAYGYKDGGYFLLKVLNIPAEKWGCPHYLPYMREYTVEQCQAANRVIEDVLNNKELLQKCKSDCLFEVVIYRHVLEIVEGTSTYDVFFGDDGSPKALLWEIDHLVSEKIK